MECKACHGSGFGEPSSRRLNNPLCPACRGQGYLNIDPEQPCPVLPFTSLAIAWKSARMSAGLPLWNALDAKDDA